MKLNKLVNYIKILIHKTLKLFGLRIHKINRDRSNLDRLYKIFLNEIQSPIIIDVGANIGQSINRFKKLNKKAIIHSFEPIKKDFQALQDKFKDDKNVFLNNIALGEKEYEKKLFSNNLSGSSSFSKLIPKTEWIKQRSSTHNINPEEAFDKEVDCKVMRLDDYCKNKQIQKIDVLKIDTQGYEDKVLVGAKKLIENKKINYVELEIIFNNIYEKKLNFFEIEKHLVPFGYELFAIQNPGNLYDDYIFQVDVIYYNPDALLSDKNYIYEDLNKKFKN